MSFNFGDASAGSSSFSFGSTSSGPSTSTTSSTAPSSGFSFGATSTALPATSSGFSFGATSSVSPPTSTGLSFGPTSTATPATSKSSSFGATLTSTTSSIASSSTPTIPAVSSTFSFGAASKPDATTSSTGDSTGSGFSFGAKVPEGEAKLTTTSGFGFGAASTEAKPTAPASSGFSFGAKPCAAEAKSGLDDDESGFGFGAASTEAKPTAPASSGFSFALVQRVQMQLNLRRRSLHQPGFHSVERVQTRLLLPTASPRRRRLRMGLERLRYLRVVLESRTQPRLLQRQRLLQLQLRRPKSPPAEYMGRTIEDIINAWSEQLERNADTFTTEAVKVSKWDSDLMDSQRKLGDIAGDVRRIQVAQNELDTNLDTIFAYQMELKSTLEQLEKSVDKMYESQDQMPVAADIEREQTLQLSVDIDDQLNSMATTLKETVEKLNKAQDDVADDSNPMVQIMKVLNVHHNSLQWIEGTSGRISSEIAQLSRKLQNTSI
ncbi:unnamed protein product [Peronospora belbahrii]|uniref:Nucleoporin NSP1-like C-terminal domain-containing protein n=1 Tax=Peronospora belbahrii TaxID=622444 RepID=A0AAU9LFL7_9STRA|nr:unnamed protein product [Peronospora belbahrii]